MSPLDNHRAKEAHESAHEHPSTTQALHNLQEKITQQNQDSATKQLNALADKILPKYEKSVRLREPEEPLKDLIYIPIQKEPFTPETPAIRRDGTQSPPQKNEGQDHIEPSVGGGAKTPPVSEQIKEGVLEGSRMLGKTGQKLLNDLVLLPSDLWSYLKANMGNKKQS